MPELQTLSTSGRDRATQDRLQGATSLSAMAELYAVQFERIKQAHEAELSSAHTLMVVAQSQSASLRRQLNRAYLILLGAGLLCAYLAVRA